MDSLKFQERKEESSVHVRDKNKVTRHINLASADLTQFKECRIGG